MICKKCGSEAGWTGPTYGVYWPPLMLPSRYAYRHPLPHKTEWLEYACVTCGYKRQEPTLDAPAPPPPEAPRCRVLREGERPCVVCGSGRDDHDYRDHSYQPRAWWRW